MWTKVLIFQGANPIFDVGSLSYLGEWHLHPDSRSAPSHVDIAQMKKISQDKNFNCKEPILLIFGKLINTQTICLMVFKEEQIYYYKENLH